VSCSSAKSATINTNTGQANHHSPVKPSTDNPVNQDIETLIGYAWLGIFKNGRLISGEKTLPIAQTISDSYLSPDNQVKWVENMKPLFRVNLAFQTTVHTIDPHVANFFMQCEKLMLSVTRSQINGDTGGELVRNKPTNLSLKRKAPIAPVAIPQNPPPPPPLALRTINEASIDKNEILIVLNDPNKEIMNNSLKVININIRACSGLSIKR